MNQQIANTGKSVSISRRGALHTLLAGIALSAIGVAPLALAHRQKQALTTVVWNATDKLLEVTHDIFAHDAEIVLAKLGRITSPDITGLRARANLALYAQEKFNLKTLGGTPIPLGILGAETDTNYAHVYLEAKLTEKPKGLIISDTLLQDIFFDQINLVNVTLDKSLKSVVFVAGTAPKKVLA